VARRRLDLRFPPNRATKPVTYHLVKDYALVTNILRARIEPGQQGRMLLDVTGKVADIDAAVAFLAKEGLGVESAASDIRLDHEKCVVCGLCTSLCRPGALTLDEQSRLVFDKDLCVYCEACVIACPRRAVTLTF